MTQTDRNPSQRARERERAVASELREYAGGRLDVDHQDVSPVSVLVKDPDLRDSLIFAEQTYQRSKSPGEPPFWSLSWVRDMLRPEASSTLTDAVENGKLSVMEYITGLPEWENDVSGLQTVRKLEDWLVHSEQCRLIYLAGLMGRGKTDWSLSMLETVDWVFRRLREQGAEAPTPRFAANFAVSTGSDDVDCLHIDNYDDLVEWAAQGSSDDELWFIFDEASTELTAQSGKNAQKVARVFAPFVKKMRKSGVNLVVVGHDRGDVHAAIRSIADFVDKTGLKTASVYGGIEDREPTDHKFDLSHIPETSWEYDTDDVAEWSWGTAVEDDGPDVADTFDPSKQSGAFTADAVREWRNSVIQTLYHDHDTSYSDIADALGVSQGTVSNALS